MTVRIYQPSRTTTQSGVGKTLNWILEYEPATPRRLESLMGWTSSGDALNQIRLRFSTREEAVRYAESQNLTYTVAETAKRHRCSFSYLDRFRTG